MNPKLISDINAFLSSDRKLFTTKGKAGTGKTEIIKELHKYLSRNGKCTLVATPTNKASAVLIKRGIDSITLHKALFRSKVATDKNGLPKTKIVCTPILDPLDKKKFIRDEKGDIKYEEKEERVWTYQFDQAQLCKHTDYFDEVVSIRTNENGESYKVMPKSENPKFLELLSQFVLIIDESSMVPYRMWEDLIENTNFKIIAVGDNNQLDPVEMRIKELSSLINNYDPDYNNEFTAQELYDLYMLELAAQQKYGNYFKKAPADYTCLINQRTKSQNIVGLFETLLTDNSARFPYPYHFNEVSVIKESEYDKEGIDVILRETDITIAWENKTVDILNNRIRQLKVPNLRYTSSHVPLYMPGEPLYVESNFKFGDIEIAKGETVRIVTLAEEYAKRIDAGRGVLHVDVILDSTKEIKSIPISLNKLGYKNTIKDNVKPTVCYVTLAYAMTCNKAQGSQWKSVVVWDDVRLDVKGMRAWRYTAVTRAEETLIVIKQGT